ncbi:MAG: GNAT family N-acetyltransferase [Actinomycetota bacterium]|nr:GNAT family N-acetyltransferase [Actinomycetota bacterium]
MTELRDGEILLRPYTESDVPALTALCQDPDVQRRIDLPVPYGASDALEYISRVETTRAIVDARTGELLGSIGWRLVDQENVQIGYWIGSDFRRRGIATRALRLLSRWALTELATGRVQLLTEPDNEASQRVAEKAGFEREGLLRRYVRLGDGSRRDGIMFSVLPEDL